MPKIKYPIIFSLKLDLLQFPDRDYYSVNAEIKEIGKKEIYSTIYHFSEKTIQFYEEYIFSYAFDEMKKKLKTLRKGLNEKSEVKEPENDEA